MTSDQANHHVNILWGYFEQSIQADNSSDIFDEISFDLGGDSFFGRVVEHRHKLHRGIDKTYQMAGTYVRSLGDECPIFLRKLMTGVATNARPEQVGFLSFVVISLGRDSAFLAPSMIKLLVRTVDQDALLAIACSLFSMGLAAESSISDLIQLLKPEVSSSVRSVSIQALANMGSTAAAAMPGIIANLGYAGGLEPAEKFDFDELVEDAIDAIGSVLVADKPSLLYLLQEFHQLSVKKHVASAIGWMGHEASDAAPALVAELMRCQDDAIRAVFIDSLSRLGPAAAIHSVPALIECLSIIESDAIRQAAAAALETLGPMANAAIPPLVQMLDGTNENRAVAAKTLRAIGTEARKAVAGRRDRTGQMVPNERASLVDPAMDAAALSNLKALKVFYLIGKLVSERASSTNQACRILERNFDKSFYEKFSDAKALNISKSTVSRIFNISLPKLFGPWFKDDRVALIEQPKGSGTASRLTADGVEAWRWTEAFLKRTLGPSWWGFGDNIKYID